MRKFTLNILDKNFEVELERINPSLYSVKLGGKRYEAQVLEMTDEDVHIAVDQNLYTIRQEDRLENGTIRTLVNRRIRILKEPGILGIDQKAGRKPEPDQVSPKTVVEEDTLQAQTKGEKAPILAPMPGKVVMVTVDVGDKVEVGDVVLILEAMKMENEITSDRDGRIAEVRVKEGDSVDAHDVLVMVD